MPGFDERTPPTHASPTSFQESTVSPIGISMSEHTDDTGKDEHGRDVELTHEDTDAERAPEEEELTDEEKEARERRDEEQRRQDIEQKSDERENDAREHTNPDNHRDEEPFNS